MFESIGQQLKKEREARFLTLEKASEATRIRTVFLKALEADDYSVMPSAAQGRGFLRNYAEYLELNIDEMIAEIQRNSPQAEEVSGPLPQVNFAETEIPPLVPVDDEQTEGLSWVGQIRSTLASWLRGQPASAQLSNQNDAIDDKEAVDPSPVDSVSVEEEIPSGVAVDDEKTEGLSWVGQLRSVLDSWLRREPATAHLSDQTGAGEAETTDPLPMEMGAESETEQAQLLGSKENQAVEEKAPLQEEIALQVGEADLTAEDSIQPVEQYQTLHQVEMKPGLISVLRKYLQSIFAKKESQPVSEDPTVPELEIPRFVPSQPATMIFAEIGAQLRERRELISLTLDEVERHTKLRGAFIKALEEGAFDKLPSPVQTRGMLANYATFLDLHTDTILLRFADGLQARRHEKYAETPREKIQTEVITSNPRLRSFIAGDLIFGVVMIAILLALAVWGVARVVSSQNGDSQLAESTAPSIVDVLGSTPLATPSLDVTFMPVDENIAVTSAAETIAPLESNANVVLSIFALERVFVRISVDGKPAFEGRFTPGETKVFEANDQVMVLTGNAAALRVIHNGRDLGLMGRAGEVISRVYLITGAVTPTATISPTPTNTLPVTATPVPIGTPTFTPTSRPPDGG
jgi:cytoskeletal protein RodZ